MCLSTALLPVFCTVLCSCAGDLPAVAGDAHSCGGHAGVHLVSRERPAPAVRPLALPPLRVGGRRGDHRAVAVERRRPRRAHDRPSIAGAAHRRGAGDARRRLPVRREQLAENRLAQRDALR